MQLIRFHPFWPSLPTSINAVKYAQLIFYAIWLLRRPHFELLDVCASGKVVTDTSNRERLPAMPNGEKAHVSQHRLDSMNCVVLGDGVVGAFTPNDAY